MKKITFFIMAFLLMITSAKAECSREEQASLLTKAASVDIAYVPYQKDYNDEFGYEYMYFKLEIQGLGNELYAISLNDGMNERLYADKLSESLYHSKILYKFDIYSKSDNCPNLKLTTKNLIIPYYNFYFEKEECAVARDFKYCQKYTNELLNITAQEFSAEYQKYWLEKNPPKEIKVSLIDKILAFLKNYYLYFLGLIIFISLVLIFIVKRREKKESLI